MTSAVICASQPAPPPSATPRGAPRGLTGAAPAEKGDAPASAPPADQGQTTLHTRRGVPAAGMPGQSPPAHQATPTAYQIWISDRRSGEVYCYDMVSTREAALDLCQQIERVMRTRTHIVSIVAV